MTCLICHDDDSIRNDYKCRVCKNSVCDKCFSNILLRDENFTFCIIKQLPIIYKCVFCNCNNRVNLLNDNIKIQLIEIIERKIFK